MATLKYHKDVVTLEFKGHAVRCRNIDGQIYIAVTDLACIANIINYWDTSHGVYTVCGSICKIVFYSSGKTLWAIEPHDVTALCKIGYRNLSNKSLELIDWAKELPIKLKKQDMTNLPNNSERVFVYNDSPIAFHKINSDVLINASEMAKQFSKSPAHWLRNQSAQDFIAELSALRNCNPTDLVNIVNGGTNYGTWMHEDVALEFARWLNPKFAIWCNDRIKELLQHGMTATPETLEKLINDPDLIIGLATTIKNERSAKELAIVERDRAIGQVEKMQPKAIYYDEVVAQREFYTTSELAGELNMAYCTLRNKLVKLKVISNPYGKIEPTEKYHHLGGVVKRDQDSYCCFKWNKMGRNVILEVINPQMPR